MQGHAAGGFLGAGWWWWAPSLPGPIAPVYTTPSFSRFHFTSLRHFFLNCGPYCICYCLCLDPGLHLQSSAAGFLAAWLHCSRPTLRWEPAPMSGLAPGPFIPRRRREAGSMAVLGAKRCARWAPTPPHGVSCWRLSAVGTACIHVRGQMQLSAVGTDCVREA